MPDPNTISPYKIGFLLIEDFSMMCITTMINPFRSANRELGYQAFTWDFISVDGLPVMASDGFQANPTSPSKSDKKYDYFFLCAGLNTDPPNRSKLNTILHRLISRSKVFGGLSTAAFILGRSGFLQNKEFTLHWENKAAFIEEFPDLKPSSALYVTDGNFWTGSGGLSSMDIALKIIGDNYGIALANTVANQYQLDRIRTANMEQKPFYMSNYNTLPPKVFAATKLMLEHIEKPLSIREICETCAITPRSLERSFNKHIGVSPKQHYIKIRLEHARQLIWHTNISMLEISILTGFPSTSYLSHTYKNEFGVTPSIERTKYNLNS